MKYKTKQVEIEAILVQPHYRNLDEIIAFVGSENLCPIERRPDYVLKIRTLEGDESVGYGDYIIKGLEGEFYPCKPSIFEKKYEIPKTIKKQRTALQIVADFLSSHPSKEFKVTGDETCRALVIEKDLSTPPKSKDVR